MSEIRYSKRLKILVSAYACSPTQGSEAAMGWGWVRALSKVHDLWIITEKTRYELEIERELKDKPHLRKHMHFVYVPRRRHALLEKIYYPSYYWTYKAWQLKAYEETVKLHEEIGFDLVHQLNMIGYREPGYLWKIDLPFVWGPVGGTQNIPLRFIPLLGKEALWHLGRTLINMYDIRLNRRVRTAIARADGFVTATWDNRDAFFKVAGKDSVVIPETMPNPNHPFREVKYPKDGSLRLVWSGLHISRKALPILLLAVTLLTSACKWHLDILGEGPLTHNWKRLAKKLGLAGSCKWHGWMKRDHAQEVMSKAHVFVFPSLMEANSNVVMEAMSMGLPVICLNHCGMADVVTEDCGVKIPVANPKKVIRDFSVTIERLARNPKLVKSLSEGAIKRIQYFSPDRQAEAMCKVYRLAIENWRDGR